MGGTYFVYRESSFDFGQQMNYRVLSIALEGFEMNRTWIKWQVTIFSFRGPYMTSVVKCSRNFPLGRWRRSLRSNLQHIFDASSSD